MAVAVVGAHGASAEAKLTYGYQLSAESNTAKDLVIPWIEEIKEKSGGGVDITLIPGGAIVTMTSVLEALRSRGVDMSMVSPAYYRKELPASALLIDITTTFEDQLAALMALTEMTWQQCPECVSEMAANNFVQLGTVVTAPYNLLCTFPVNSPEDLKGKRVRAHGLTTNYISVLGAIPVNVAYTELYESLQRRVIDCALADTYWLEQASLKEVVTHVLNVNVAPLAVPGNAAIRKDLWDTMDEEDKKIIFSTHGFHMAHNLAKEQETIAAIVEETKDRITFIEAADWAMDAINKVKDGMVAEAITTAETSGVQNAAALAETYLEIYAKWQRELEGMEVNEENIRNLLDENFFNSFIPS